MHVLTFSWYAQAHYPPRPWWHLLLCRPVQRTIVPVVGPTLGAYIRHESIIAGWRLACWPSGAVSVDVWAAHGVLPTGPEHSMTGGVGLSLDDDTPPDSMDAFTRRSLKPGDVVVGNIATESALGGVTLTLCLTGDHDAE